ncbi:hypothetical protein MKEN_00640500 [Mycena kentingensis (nom. inval.)]|nr:hypothetical protein MKEN_00640500 [Mycena kentingensis (nom. inval.)]
MYIRARVCTLDHSAAFMPIPEVYEFAFACCNVAAVALVIWDHAITFGEEVRRVWTCGRKFSGASVLYAMMRYGTLLEKIAVLLLASWYMTPQGFVCNAAVRIQIVPMLVRTVGFGLFSSLRVLALTEQNWALSGLVFLLCVPSAIVPSFVYSNQWAQGVGQYGCKLAYLASPIIHDRLRISGIVADILAEFTVIGVTLQRTFQLRHSALPTDGYGKARPGLAVIMLRTGCIYFVALLVLSLADMLVLLFDHVPEFATRYDYWVVPYYTPVFRTIIICRFLLMLRAVYLDDGADSETGPTAQDQDRHSLHFAAGGPGSRDSSDSDFESRSHSSSFASRLIGNLGAPVDASCFDGTSEEEENWEYNHNHGDAYELSAANPDTHSIRAKDPLAAGLELMATEDKLELEFDVAGLGRRRSLAGAVNGLNGCGRLGIRSREPTSRTSPS